MSKTILKGPVPNYTINLSLGEFFFSSLNRYKDKICQIDAGLDIRESYSSVKERSIRLALELKNQGITSKDVIATCTKVTLDSIIPILGSLYLGAKVANLDTSLSLRQTTHLLSLVKPSVIFVEESSVALIEDSLKSGGLKSEIVVFGESKKYLTFHYFVTPKHREENFVPTEVDIHDTAIILFSSRTTGLPKGICHSHYSFLNIAYSLYSSGIECDNILSFSSFYWISGITFLVSSFIGGGCRIFCGAMEAEKTLKVVEKYRAKYLFLAPNLTYKLTNFEEIEKYDVSSVYSVLIAGTPLSSKQFEKLQNIFTHSNIILSYGQSEAGFVTIFDLRTDSSLIKTKLGSCGKPSVEFSIKVVDIETNKALGPNQKGELRFKSPAVMKGYYNVDSSPLFDEEGFLKSGDIGYYDEDGCFYVIERIKEMFKYMSWHVVPSAVEAVLLEHPAVKEAAVFGVPKSEEEGEVPTAAVVLKDGFQIKKEEIEMFVAEKVSDYEKLRGGVIMVDSLMKSPSGKLMRKQIRDSIINSNMLLKLM